MKKFITYVVGVFGLGILTAFLVSTILNFLPIIGVTLIVALPFYGVFREKKHLQAECFHLKSWLNALWEIFRPNRKSFTFYFVLGIASTLIYEEILVMILKTLLVTTIAFLVVALLWNTVYLILKKTVKIHIPNFKEAIKQVW